MGSSCADDAGRAAHPLQLRRQGARCQHHPARHGQVRRNVRGHGGTAVSLRCAVTPACSATVRPGTRRCPPGPPHRATGAPVVLMIASAHGGGPWRRACAAWCPQAAQRQPARRGRRSTVSPATWSATWSRARPAAPPARARGGGRAAACRGGLGGGLRVLGVAVRPRWRPPGGGARGWRGRWAGAGQQRRPSPGPRVGVGVWCSKKVCALRGLHDWSPTSLLTAPYAA